MTPKRIKELRELCKKATQQWIEDCTVAIAGLKARSCGPLVELVQSAVDRDFIAASRTALPECLDEIERLESNALDYFEGAAEFENDIMILRAELKKLSVLFEKARECLGLFAKIDIDFIAKDEPFRHLIVKARACLEELG